MEKFTWRCMITLALLCAATAEDGWFWHVTDFHYDFSYNGSDLSCNSDVTDHGQYGNYWCDSPWKLIDSSVEAMKKFKPDVDFILWTGDSVLHTEDENLSFDINDGILDNLTTLLNDSFTQTSVYATFGNHDYHPNNQFPATNNLLYNKTLEKWFPWIRDIGQKENFWKGGYYTVVTDHGIRIVALNTNLYYTSDKLTGNLSDPAGQFAWLETVLTSAVNKNEKVLITGHVPPGIINEGGKPWMYPHFNTKMNDVIRKYADVIIGLHFGHEHIDNFRIYFKGDSPTAVLYMAPSVTPWRYIIPGRTGPAHNPAIRLVNYDRQTGRHINVIQYYMDLPASNSRGTPVWAEEYNATRDYNIDDLSPSSFHELVQRMDKANSPEFENHFKWRVVSVSENLQEECNSVCKANIMCTFSHVDQSPFDACVVKAVGQSWRVMGSVIVFLAALIGLFIVHVRF